MKPMCYLAFTFTLISVSFATAESSLAVKSGQDLKKHSPSNFTKPIDLSHYLDENTPGWYKAEGYNRTKVIAGYMIPPDNAWYAENQFKAPEHIGTHLDAPYHFNPKGAKVADIPLESLFHVEGKRCFLSAKGVVDIFSKEYIHPNWTCNFFVDDFRL